MFELGKNIVMIFEMMFHTYLMTILESTYPTRGSSGIFSNGFTRASYEEYARIFKCNQVLDNHGLRGTF